jgi:hypothetical protein
VREVLVEEDHQFQASLGYESQASFGNIERLVTKRKQNSNKKIWIEAKITPLCHSYSTLFRTS